MTTYYADSINGNPANGGTSWADAKQTLNGVEDIPVAANDTVYCRGEFPELLTLDVSGSAGNPITYEGVVHPATGLQCRITGSNNNATATRANAINDAAGRDYRTFRNLHIDLTSSYGIHVSGDGVIIEDCAFQDIGANPIFMDTPNQDNLTVRRCLFLNSASAYTAAIRFYIATTLAGVSHTIENCLFLQGYRGMGVTSEGVSNILVRNCGFYSGFYHVATLSALASGQITVNNSWHTGANVCFSAITPAANEIVEDYNNVFGNATNRSNVSVGAHDTTNATLLDMPKLFDGKQYPWWMGKLSSRSALTSIAGTGVASDDMFGFTRSGPSSWGPIEYAVARDDQLHERYVAGRDDMSGGMRG